MEMKLFDLYVNVNGINAVQKIMIVGKKEGHDVNGVPIHMLEVYMYDEKEGYGFHWYPELPGRRQRKDGKYRIKGNYKSLQDVMEEFRNELQVYIEEN